MPEAMRAVVVYKRSEYRHFRELSAKSPEHARYLKSGHWRVGRMKDADRAHYKSVQIVEQALKALGINYFSTSISNSEHFMEQMRDHYDLAIAVGGDGTVLHTAKFIRNSTPILGVNSDPGPGGSRGHYCATDAKRFKEFMKKISAAPRAKFNRLEVLLSNSNSQMGLFDQSYALALNEVEILNQPKLNAAMRFELQEGKAWKFYACDGLLVCAPGGSTAKMYEHGGSVMEPADRRVQYLVLGKRGETSRFGKVVRLINHTSNAKMLIDADDDPIHLELGTKVEMRGGGTPVTIIGDFGEKLRKYAAAELKK